MLIKIALISAHSIELISIGIIMWGVLLALYRIGVLAVRSYRTDMDLTYSWLRMRRMFGETLLLGLQFLVAADAILTIANPNIELIGVLAAIVLIRIALSLALGKEIQTLAERDKETIRSFPHMDI